MKYAGTMFVGSDELQKQVVLFRDGYFDYRCYLGYDRDAEPIFVAVDRSPFNQSAFRPAPIEDVCRVYRTYIQLSETDDAVSLDQGSSGDL